MTPTTASNPLRAGLRLERTPEPCVLVILGASGDLTSRKLVPALFRLAQHHHLPSNFSVLGMARRPLSDEAFRESMAEAVEDDEQQQALWQSFASGLFYFSGNFDDQASYEQLRDRLAQIDRERGTGGNHVFYLATPPSFFPTIVERLGAVGLISDRDAGQGWTRVVVEKPFGRDLASARSLNQTMHRVLNEQQIYRIDHYLGKETVQNIQVFRFANAIFEPIWNRRYVDHVQITVAESLGVEGRGAYYEEAGALRDMVQSHMFQLLTLTAMEPPVAFDADAIRDEKVKVLRAIPPFTPEMVLADSVGGQYGPGWINGKPVPAYRQEERVAPESRTETYAALKVEIQNWRWEGVPFYLRTAKRLPRRVTEIAIQFRQVPHRLFRNAPTESDVPDVLTMRIQPDEGIALKFDAKLPGPTMRLRPVTMEFRYGTSFDVAPGEAYERLLLDVMLGDSTLFARHDEVERAWEILTPLLETWAPQEPQTYEAGSWGPKAADELIERDGRHWRRL
jgi:glucose-6-phosphate 1-dehydrogenase